MRRFRLVQLCALCLAVVATEASAQTPYPSKPIRIIVPYAPGGLTDVVARLYSEQLRQSLGRGGVFVENKPGASGIIAIEEMARAKPDGHTLLIGNISTNGLTPVLLAKKMKIDYEREVRVITPLADVPVFFLGTTTNFPPQTFGEFLVYAKEHPGKVRYGSAGMAAISRSTRKSSPSAPTSTWCTFRSRAAAPRSSATSPTATSTCRGSTSPTRSG
jgi:tripartite-type tricarboxylate transporter receptor subunit TctC